MLGGEKWFTPNYTVTLSSFLLNFYTLTQTPGYCCNLSGGVALTIKVKNNKHELQAHSSKKDVSIGFVSALGEPCKEN